MELWNLRKMSTDIFFSKEKDNITHFFPILKINDIFVVVVQTNLNLSQTFDVENLFTSHCSEWLSLGSVQKRGKFQQI